MYSILQISCLHDKVTCDGITLDVMNAEYDASDCSALISFNSDLSSGEYVIEVRGIADISAEKNPVVESFNKVIKSGDNADQDRMTEIAKFILNNFNKSTFLILLTCFRRFGIPFSRASRFSLFRSAFATPPLYFRARTDDYHRSAGQSLCCPEPEDEL